MLFCLVSNLSKKKIILSVIGVKEVFVVTFGYVGNIGCFINSSIVYEVFNVTC